METEFIPDLYDKTMTKMFSEKYYEDGSDNDMEANPDLNLNLLNDKDVEDSVDGDFETEVHVGYNKKWSKTQTNKRNKMVSTCGLCVMSQTASNRSKRVTSGMTVRSVTTLLFVKNATKRTLLTPTDLLKLKWLQDRVHPKTATN